MSTPRRVVVTGLGVTSAIGTGIERFWESLVGGRSGIGPTTRCDVSALRSRIAGEVRDLDVGALPSKAVKRSARFAQLGLAAAFEALASAALPETGRENAAVIVGSGIGGFEFLTREHATFLARGPEKFHPLTVPIIIPNMAAGLIAIEAGLGGPNLCITTACASGGHSLGVALDLIRTGRCEVALAGSAESCIEPFAIDGYCQLRALSTRNDQPERASRPFSRTRDGFVLSEGAGMLVLEALDHARARGARVWAELAGSGASGDAYHPTAPDPDGRGAVRAMRAALADARLSPEQVDVVNAHATSTPVGDGAEVNALHQVFGAHTKHLMVHATKSMTGHALGGAGALEAVAAALTVARGVVHPTINLDDPEFDLDFVPGSAREAAVHVVMSNSFGFGGHNAVVVFRRFER